MKLFQEFCYANNWQRFVLIAMGVAVVALLTVSITLIIVWW